MGNVQALLKGSMEKLGELVQQGGSRHMCYLIVFVVFVLLLLYFIISWTSKSSRV
jgi:blocked-early-in-transport protein 1